MRKNKPIFMDISISDSKKILRNPKNYSHTHYSISVVQKICVELNLIIIVLSIVNPLRFKISIIVFHKKKKNQK